MLTPVADPQWLQVDLGPVRQIYRVTLGVNAAASDIFGCAASLAADPDMCAALDRHVATLPASRQADPSQYYKAAPANHYARFWDDVAGRSSFISHDDPQWLLVAVGW
ncbi:beta-1,3-glucanase family protein [Streptomyces sp. NPDC048253]|uniref:beta-1,3-glucanase family protein n=1 Tax=Streptomyces sp. NPDC048253 TaxID=3365524 RepID=UPI00371ED5F3